MRLLMSGLILATLGGCAVTSVEVTPVKGSTRAPLPADAPVALWISPAFSADTIETLVARYGALELTTRPRGRHLGTVEIRHTDGLAGFARAMAEARRLGGNAILVASAGNRNLKAQVYRSGK